LTFFLRNELRSVKTLACGALTLLASSPSAQAAYLWVSDGTIHIRGAIERGDAEAFQRLLKDNPGARVVALDGPGGALREAISIAEAVRKARLATVVDAARVSCDSACTLIFAGGVSRHYLNAADLAEGVGGHYGLGYHSSYNRGDRVTPPIKSEEGVRLMDAFYARMGSGGASVLARRASISTLWRPNVATALKLRLATSAQPPNVNRAPAR
jgi:hypothetical protein